MRRIVKEFQESLPTIILGKSIKIIRATERGAATHGATAPDLNEEAETPIGGVF